MSDPLLIRDLMTVGVQTCTPDTPIADIARLLLDKELEGLVVLDAEGHGVGIVTWEELITGYGHPSVDKLTAEDIMYEGVPELPPDIPLTVAAQMMQDMGLRIVFFMHNASGIIYPAAMLTYRHILRHLAAESEADLRDLGIRADREAPLDVFIRKRDSDADHGYNLPDQE
jgi:predicted transcriptional regulator